MQLLITDKLSVSVLICQDSDDVPRQHPPLVITEGEVYTF